MKPSLKSITLMLLVLILASCLENEKPSHNSQIEQYLKFISEMKSRGFNTGNILVYEHGEVIFQSSHGLRNIHPLDSLTLGSQFRIASVSKQFTAVAIMKLKQWGKLDYDQKVNSILPDFPYDTITIRHLLNHTSGLADYEDVIAEKFNPKDTSKRYILGNNEILKIYYRVHSSLEFEPGEKWEYCNTGYMILATIVETITQQHFRDFLKEHIFDPVGMSNTLLYQYQEGEDPEMPNRVFGYQKAFNQINYELNDYDIVNDVRGDGGIYSTLNDLYKWNMALVNGEVLPPEFLAEAWSRGTLNNGEKTRYGFGWKFPKNTNLPKAVFHAGGWTGFGTFLYNEIETKSGYVVLTNDSWESFIPITDAIDSIRIGGNYILPKRSIAKGFQKEILTNGKEAAINFYQKNKSKKELYKVDVNELNNLGYELIQHGYLKEAVTVFKLNTEEYPYNANAFDSFGDGLLEIGDTTKAIKNFRIALQMDASFQQTKDKIEALVPNGK